eukprot:scaffold259247_cov34-Tisochrysis_lutea.AAC.3
MQVGPVPWLQPYTDDKIRELAEAGTHSLVVVPISFVSEHIETLEEIDVEYRELAEEAGITSWQRVPALGIEQDFIEDLAAAVVEALPKMEQRPLQVPHASYALSEPAANAPIRATRLVHEGYLPPSSI